MGGKQGQKRPKMEKEPFKKESLSIKDSPLCKKRSRERKGPLQPAAIATLELEYKDHMTQIFKID